MTIDEARQQMFDAILEYGHAVVLSPANDRVSVPYAYTVGRTMKDRPEILIAGIHGDAAKNLLNEMVLVDDLLGINFDHGDFPIGGTRVKFIESHPVAASFAVAMFSVKVKAVQGLLLDATTGYEPTEHQPHVLAIDPTAYDPYDEEY